MLTKLGLKRLNIIRLDKRYAKLRPMPQDGLYTEGYENGQKEIETYYKKGKINGSWKVWYPNGQLYIGAYYKKDKLHGKWKVWYANGQLKEDRVYKKGEKEGIALEYGDDGHVAHSSKYKHGKLIDTTYYFQKDYIDSGKYKVKYIRIYDKIGQLTYASDYDFPPPPDLKIFNTKDDKYYLRNEAFYDIKKDICTSFYYHANGKVSEKSYTQISKYKNIGLFQRWDENGKLITTWEYDVNGKQINIKKY